ncbi:hypothetical protein B4U80_13264 [Leptotrombidium deliense]|uniref:Uncharacterized protein n=1 Tax=Leptotrombidium deliense TaxID=299467 RepID=A0A443S9F7_9ACAR|nr:hypothetical protein B4U80_13264 [Leptotrombidium deliense]
MKLQADKMLNLRHNVLIIGDIEDGITIFRSSFKRHLDFLSVLYSNIAFLLIGTSTVPLKLILKTFHSKFLKLKKLKIYDINCGKEVCQLIAEVFPYLKQLTLIDLDSNDENIKIILDNLNLERLSIQGVYWLTGEFVNSIGESVKTLKYKEINMKEYKGETVLASLDWSLVNKVLSITRLDLKVKGLEDDFFVSLSKLTPNLKSLVFDGDALHNLSHLKLPLSDLSLKILGEFSVPNQITEPMTSVKTLDLELWIKEDICRDLINLLSAFPSIENLSFFNYSGFFSFKKKFLKVLGEMKNLQKFTFKDCRDEERLFFRFPNGQRYNVLLRAIDWLDKVKEFNFEVDAFSKIFCTELVAALQFHAEQRPDQQINITFRVYGRDCSNFIKKAPGYPPNFTVEIDYW